VVSPGISWEFNETGTSVTLWFLRREETQIRLWILILLLLYLVIICQKESTCKFRKQANTSWNVTWNSQTVARYYMDRKPRIWNKLARMEKRNIHQTQGKTCKNLCACHWCLEKNGTSGKPRRGLSTSRFHFPISKKPCTDLLCTIQFLKLLYWSSHESSSQKYNLHREHESIEKL
jgi:hypothetical protein